MSSAPRGSSGDATHSTPSTRARASRPSRARAPRRSAGVLRHGVPQAAHVVREARGGHRRVDARDRVDERVHPRAARRGALLHARVRVRRVEANPRFAPRDVEHAAVVHRIEQLRRRARRAAPVVRDGAVREGASTSRGCTTPRARTKREHRARSPHCARRATAARRPRAPSRAGAGGAATGARERRTRSSRRSPRRRRARGSAARDAGAITLHAVPQDQVLRARRRADWIGLHEPELRVRQRPCDGEATQVVLGHAPIMPQGAGARRGASDLVTRACGERALPRRGQPALAGDAVGHVWRTTAGGSWSSHASLTAGVADESCSRTEHGRQARGLPSQRRRRALARGTDDERRIQERSRIARRRRRALSDTRPAAPALQRGEAPRVRS